MSSTEMVNTLGADRCAMQRDQPNGAKPLWRFVRGGGWITIHLNAGWYIVHDERNHLMGDYGGSGLVEGAAQAVPEHHEAPLPHVAKSKGGRPLGSKNKLKTRKT